MERPLKNLGMTLLLFSVQRGGVGSGNSSAKTKKVAIAAGITVGIARGIWSNPLPLIKEKKTSRFNPN